MLGRAVRELFSDNIVKRGYRAYQSRLVERLWVSPKLGYALALNTRFSATATLSRLLDALAASCESTTEYPKLSKEQLRRATRERETEVRSELLFGSYLRTATLIALDAVGGETTSGLLAKAVCGQHPSSVKNAIRFFTRERVLCKTGTRIFFAPDAPWTQPLRALLRELAGELREIADFARLAASCVRAENAPNGKPAAPLFTYVSSVRFLSALAVNGPMRLRDVVAAAGSKSEKRLQRLLRIGILCRSHGSGAVYYSLNAAHPVYRELRALLRALSTQPATKARRVDGAEPRDSFEIDRLFGPRLCTNVLIMLATMGGEADTSSLFRLLPEHDRNHIGFSLDRYERIGLLTSRRWKTLRLFRLNQDWPAYRELVALLRAIAQRWPDDYLDAATLTGDLKPTLRKRMEARAIFGTYSEAHEPVA